MSALITKKAIAQAMKDLMETHSFEKITVGDITERCGLNRQSFYYHFNDKYTLLNWIFDQDVFSLITQDFSLENWRQSILKMLTEMYRSEKFYANALKHLSHSEFEEHLLVLAKERFLRIVETVAVEISEEEMRFIADFYAYGSVGMIIAWAKSGMRQPPEQLTAQLSRLVYDSRSVEFLRAEILPESPEIG
jgi:probable dihydroxyacetone kinase regulator